MGPSWGRLGALWGCMERLLVRLGALLGRLGGTLGGPLGRLKAGSGAAWAVLERRKLEKARSPKALNTHKENQWN